MTGRLEQLGSSGDIERSGQVPPIGDGGHQRLRQEQVEGPPEASQGWYMMRLGKKAKVCFLWYCCEYDARSIPDPDLNRQEMQRSRSARAARRT